MNAENEKLTGEALREHLRRLRVELSATTQTLEDESAGVAGMRGGGRVATAAANVGCARQALNVTVLDAYDRGALEVAPDDGRPCSTDVFLAHAATFEGDVDYKRTADWLDGDWVDALHGLPDVAHADTLASATVQEVAAFDRMTDDVSLTYEQVAETCGVSVARVRLLDPYPEPRALFHAEV